MQKQTKPEPLGAPMAKLVLAVSLIVGIGAVAGVMGYVITKPKCEVPKSDGRAGMPMREAPKHIPKSCAKNEDCGIDTCQQGRDKCVEIRYVCEMGKCAFPAQVQEFLGFMCQEDGTCKDTCGDGICQPIEELHCPKDCVKKEEPISNWKTYRNENYGFEVTLLDSWKGYSTLTESWGGTTLDGNSVQYQGPKIIIRNPKWSVAQPWQDIPILVFTKDEWQLIEANNLGISAAPIGPSMLDENQKYVFALPPRWVGFTDDLGQDEAQEIVNTIKAIPFHF